MANTKVGDGEATIGKIVLTITKCTGYAALDTKWTNLAKVLEANPISVVTWKKSLLLERDTLDDVMEKLLMEWVNKKSILATILQLAQAFIDIGMDDIAKEIMKKFGKTSSLNSNPSTLQQSVTSEILKNSMPTFNFTNPMQIILDELKHITVEDGNLSNDEQDGNCASNSKGEDVVDLRKSEFFKDFKIVRPQVAMTFENDFYKLPVENKGIALILNIIEYTGRKFLKRKGAQFDSLYMAKLWIQLGYRVQLEHEGMFSKARVEKIIKNFRKRCDSEKPNSIVIFLGGHGGHDELIMSNEVEKMHVYRDIVLKFKQSKCTSLTNKPKIFLISACQEFAMDSGSLLPVETDARQQMELEHTIVAYSTLPGYFSIRYHYLGTVYAYCFTRVMIAEAHKSHFRDILEKVEEMMAKVITTAHIDQQPNYRRFGFKKLYFNMEPQPTE